MNKIKITNSSKPITKEDIKDLESKYDFIFPYEYKNFLLKHNGGEPSHKYFTTRNGKIHEIISRFFPIDINDKFSLQSEIEEITLEKELPADLIPIAITPGESDRVVLCISGENYGKVYHWSWGAQEDNCEPSYEFVEIVADSFNEFLDMLTDTRDF